MYTKSRAGRSIQIAAVVFTFALLECADFVAPFAPSVTNEVDNFDFRTPDLTGVTTTARYMWETTGNNAHVTVSSALTAGTGTVTVTDGEATLIYARALDGIVSETTSSGTAGFWTITVALSNARGPVHFTLQKP